MRAVFLDTVGLLALWDVRDAWHGAAEAAYRRLLADRAPLVTSTFVLLETETLRRGGLTAHRWCDCATRWNGRRRC